MNEIYNVAKLVREALENYPKARNSDNFLYYIICKEQLAKKASLLKI